MATRSSGRLVLALIYLVALFGGGGWLYARMQRFEGETYLREGRPERLVARPSGGGFALSAAYRNLPAEVLPWADTAGARRHFGTEGLVDAAELPGPLVLERLEILEVLPPREVLVVSAAGLRDMLPVEPGAVLPGDGPALRMVGLRPWSGLVRDPRGRPMAALRLRDAGAGDWSEVLLVAAGTWTQGGGRFALRFRWHGGEAAARHALESAGPAGASARWGVRDGKAMHWIEGLAPGSGVGLSDGSEVTLVRQAAAPPGAPQAGPALLLAHVREGKAEPHWVTLEPDPEGIYRYEDPARAAFLVEVAAWREDQCLVAAWHAGAPLGIYALAMGEAWAPDGAPLALLPVQALSAAIPVPVADPPVMALHLESDTGPLVLREGELITRGDLRLRYRRVPVPPRVRAHLRYRPVDGGDPVAFSLDAGGEQRLGDWIVSLDPTHLDPHPSAVLHARRTLGAPSRLAGAGLFVVAAFGLVLARFARWPVRAPTDAAVLPGAPPPEDDDAASG
jgi:hypothetical protein